MDKFTIIENTEIAQSEAGVGYNSYDLIITESDFKALKQGKCLYFCDGESSIFIAMSEAKKLDCNKNDVIHYTCKCGSTDFFITPLGHQKGLYCKSCGKWVKWLGKDEYNLISAKLKGII